MEDTVVISTISKVSNSVISIYFPCRTCPHFNPGKENTGETSRVKTAGKTVGENAEPMNPKLKFKNWA